MKIQEAYSHKVTKSYCTDSVKAGSVATIKVKTFLLFGSGDVKSLIFTVDERYR